jgi:hypothetical protein
MLNDWMNFASCDVHKDIIEKFAQIKFPQVSSGKKIDVFQKFNKKWRNASLFLKLVKSNYKYFIFIVVNRNRSDKRHLKCFEEK